MYLKQLNFVEIVCYKPEFSLNTYTVRTVASNLFKNKHVYQVHRLTLFKKLNNATLLKTHTD